jgi:cysteine synthase A
MFNYFTNGKPEKKGMESITEGIGQARVTKNLENCLVDQSFFVSDQECMEMLFKIMKTDGLFLGLSSGVNICGAVKLAKSMGTGKKIVTILCDDANKYYDKMFNKEYLISKNLPYADWM